MDAVFAERADRSQAAESQFLTLRWLFQLGRVHLGDAELRLEGDCWIEVRHANLPNRAVTDEVSEAENVSDDRLIMRLPEHE